VAGPTDHIHTPVTGLTVEGFTSDNANRQGVTVAEVASSVLDDVHVIGPAAAGFDFGSGVAGVGSSNVTMSNGSNDKGFNIVGFLARPINRTGCDDSHHVTLRSLSGNARVTISGGTFTCKRADPRPCIDQLGGSLTPQGFQVARMRGTIGIHEPVWSVSGGGSLVFVDSSVRVPIGTIDAPSTVTPTPCAGTTAPAHRPRAGQPGPCSRLSRPPSRRSRRHRR